MKFKSDLMLEISSKLVRNKDYVNEKTKVNKYITKTITKISTEKLKEKFNREKGTYITLSFPFDNILISMNKEKLIGEMTSALKLLFKECKIEKPKKVLVVGLGNSKVVADSLGSKVIERTLVTRHAILSGLEKDDKLCEVSAFSCGVFGETGFESYDSIKGIMDTVKPELVIMIDTLVASSIKWLCSNIQLANVGIVPGSGVDNARKEISSATLNVPVITIGVPFVVYAKSLIEGEVERLAKSLSSEKFEYDAKDKLLDELIVTPSDIDEVIKHFARIIGEGINKSLNPNITEKELETFFI